MKNSHILLLALAGVGGLTIGGALAGFLGVTLVLLAVWAVGENDRLADLDRELDRAYGPVDQPAARLAFRPGPGLILSPAR